MNMVGNDELELGGVAGRTGPPHSRWEDEHGR